MVLRKVALVLLIAAIVVGVGAASASAAGLIRYWQGDGDATDAADGNNGSLVGGAAFGPGQVGQAFDVGGPYVEIPDSPSLHSNGGLTVAGRFKVDNLAKLSTWQSIYWKGDTPDCQPGCSNREYALWLNNGGYLHFTSTPLGHTFQLALSTSVGTIVPGQWYHFATVINPGDKMEIFVDGVPKGSTAYPAVGIKDTTGPLRIGKSPTWDSSFTGSIDELEFYNKALSSTEVGQLASGTVCGSCSGNLVSNWSGEGNGNDGQGVNDGTLHGALSFEAGQVGQAFRIRGTGGYVTVPDSANLRLGKQQTVSAWINPSDRVHDWARVVGKGSGFPRNYGLWRRWDGVLLFQIYGDVPTAACIGYRPSDATAVAPIGQWTHVTGTYDGTRIKLYVNGVLKDNRPCTSTPRTSPDPLTIGYAGFHTFFAGSIDDVRVYNVALSEGEVETLLVRDVVIDIKPGSDDNPINLKGKGVVPVAIRSTDNFDATSADASTIRFGLSMAKEAHDKAHWEDVDKDGAIDLVLHFRTKDTGIAKGDTEACLVGETNGGQQFKGCDLIKVK